MQLSGGSAAVMDRDFEQLKSGGKTDPVFGTQPAFYFPPVTAERVLKDWDVLTLGNIKMTALLGAGHTRGATTWVTTVEDGGRSYNVVFSLLHQCQSPVSARSPSFVSGNCR